MEKARKKLFDEYFSSIFSHSNVFSKKEFENAYLQFEINYGNYISSQKDAKIMDIGCGTGHFLFYLEKKGYKNFLGIDISQQQVNFCRDNVSKHVELADAFEFLKDKKNVYGVIAANDLLEHIPKGEINRFLKLVNNSLKSEGIFIMRTPNMGNPFSVYSRYKDFTHEAGYTDRSLYQVLWIAGFRDIQILPYNRYFPRSLKRFIELKLAKIISFIIVKLFQIQGFVEPKILTPLLIGVAKNNKKCEGK